MGLLKAQRHFKEMTVINKKKKKQKVRYWHLWFFIVEKRSLDFLNVLYSKKTLNIVNEALQASLS